MTRPSGLRFIGQLMFRYIHHFRTYFIPFNDRLTAVRERPVPKVIPVGASGAKLPERIVAWIYDHRWICLFVCLFVTVLAAWQVTFIGVDNSLEVWFLEDDPTLTSYRDFQTAYGNDEIVIIALFNQSDDMLNSEGFDAIRKATRAVQALEGVADVRSLVTVSDVQPGPTGLQLVPMVPEGDLTEEQARSVRMRVLTDPLVRGKLVSGDGTVAILLAHLDALSDIDVRRGAILDRINTALEEEKVSFRTAGVGVIYEGLNKASTRDSAVFIIGSYVIIAGLLWLLYRRLVPTIVSLVGAGVAAMWTLGIYGTFGCDFNMVSMVLPTLVFIIGLADSIHILMFVSRLPCGEDRRNRVVYAVGHMLRPCLFNTLTTAGAFAAFATSRMLVIRDFGLFAAAGLLCAFVATIVVCVWALHWERTEPRMTDKRLLQRAVVALVDLGVRRSYIVLAAAIALAVVAGIGLSRIMVDTYSIDFLPDSHPVRQDADFVESRFGPFTPLEFVLAARNGTTLRPDVLNAVNKWQRRVEQERIAGWTFSAVDPLKRLNGALSEDYQQSGLPEDPIRLAMLAMAYKEKNPRDFGRWVDSQGRVRVCFGIPMASANELGERIKTIRSASTLPRDVTLTVTGYIPLYVKMMDYVVETQISSFLFAFVVVFIFISLLFRSGRMALLAVPANLLPVLLVLGLMGLVGIRLDVATVTTGAIVLGLVVDDTVHLLHRLGHVLPLANDPVVGLRMGVSEVGTAMMTTTLVLSFGFAVLALAQVKSVAYFGILLAAALMSALAADLLVVPALVALTWKKPRSVTHVAAAGRSGQ